MGSITAIRIRQMRRRVSNQRTQEAYLCLECPGGTVYLAQSVLESAGDRWDRVCALAKQQAERHGVPFVDESGQNR